MNVNPFQSTQNTGLTLGEIDHLQNPEERGSVGGQLRTEERAFVFAKIMDVSNGNRNGTRLIGMVACALLAASYFAMVAGTVAGGLIGMAGTFGIGTLAGLGIGAVVGGAVAATIGALTYCLLRINKVENAAEIAFMPFMEISKLIFSDKDEIRFNQIHNR